MRRGTAGRDCVNATTSTNQVCWQCEHRVFFPSPIAALSTVYRVEQFGQVIIIYANQKKCQQENLTNIYNDLATLTQPGTCPLNDITFDCRFCHKTTELNGQKNTHLDLLYS